MEISSVQMILIFLVGSLSGMGSILDEFQTHRPLSTILVIAGKQDMGTGIALAIPLAAAGQVLTILVRTLTVGFQHAADNAVKTGNLGTITWLHLTALLMQAMRVAIPAVIVASTVGTDSVKHMLDSIPPVVTGGLNVAGGMIVVVGYAMVINMMRAPHLMMFFFVGFVVAAFTNFNLVALGVLGVALAYFYIQMHPKYHKGSGSAVAASNGRSKLDDQLD